MEKQCNNKTFAWSVWWLVALEGLEIDKLINSVLKILKTFWNLKNPAFALHRVFGALNSFVTVLAD